MRGKAIVFSAAVVVGLLAGCAAPLLTPDERKEVCHVTVREMFGAPVFRANLFSNPMGGLVGAGAGALMGLQGGPLAILTVPIGAAVGAAGGAVCGAASFAHPNADAEFETLLHAVDVDTLTRTLATELNAARPECRHRGESNAHIADSDTVVEISKLAASMGCLFGKMNYLISVDWRAVNQRTGKELCSTATRCIVTSFRDADAWFADPGRAQAELESALAATGRRMAQQLLAQDVLRGECRLQSNEAGEVTSH